MNRIIPTILVAGPAFLASAAMAQSATTAAPAELKPSVTPYGIIQSALFLEDSERKNTFDSSLAIVRFGLKVNHGIAKGQIELQATANECIASDSYKYRAAEGNVTAGVTKTSLCQDKNQLVVRRADVGFDIALTDMMTLTPMFGRVRAGDVGGYGVDATNVTKGFASMDGVGLSLNIKLSEGNEVLLSGYYGNSMYNPAETSSLILHDGHSARDDRAFIVSARATLMEHIKANVYYGSDKNTFASKIAPGVVETADATANPGIEPAKVTAYDFNRWEASLGYDLGNIAAGVFVWQYNYGNTKPVTKNDNGELSFGDEGSDAKTITNIGFGVNGDSTLFGVSDLLQTGDKLTYGASVVRHMADADYNTQLAIGGGYNVGGLTVELDYAHTMAKFKSFKDKDGKPTDKQDQVYLTGYYVF